ncbi:MULTISPECIES: hypothetical protein [Bacillaceae]|uniref:DUF2802 domain-containing protein n=1 Tax=Evansella alkalicola TaxID=745819 RepID=A0ABS6JV27_9BACI|nr:MULTISPECIES: hypothetical protein [Bacillaceae]MBU9722441.1 hypothetical protein [Bacillus alkalicola]
MGWIIFISFSISALLFILSFIQKDRSKELEKQVENLSIQLMQEMYQVKQKMKVIEEEFVISSNETTTSPSTLTRDDILSMYEEGYSINDIASMTNRHEDDIDSILANTAEGMK